MPRRGNETAGVLLAAGRSRRMGQPKQLLPWPPGRGNSTLVAAAFDAIAPLCSRMFVVVDFEHEAVLRVLGERDFTPVHSDGRAEMLRSVQTALQLIVEIPEIARVVLHPGDIPEVPRHVLARLAEESDRSLNSVVLPENEGRGGHPVFIPRGFFEGILAFPGEGGLRQHWVNLGELVKRVPVTDAQILRDVDVPDDYAS